MRARSRLDAKMGQPPVPAGKAFAVAAVARQAPQQLAPPGNAAQRLSLVFLLIFLFLVYSRILDYYLSSLHLPLIISVLALCLAVASGGIFRLFRSSAGVFLTLYLAWMAICVPLAFWRGGSVQQLLAYTKSFLVFVLIVTSIRRSRNVIHAAYAIVLSMVVVVFLCITFGVTDQLGRLTLVNGLLGNSNDLAQVLLVSIPFWILFGNSPNSLSIRPLISAIGIFVMLYLIMKTGSRAVMVGVFTVACISFVGASLINKIKFAAGGVVMAVILVIAMPSALLRDRYATIFSSERAADSEPATDLVSASALASTSQRVELLKRSMAMTLRHPVFGVGPGNFQPASADAFGNDLGSAWFETHNTLTQISSEIGFPGLILFCAALFYSFRSVWRLSRWELPTGQASSPAAADHLRLLNRIAACLLLSLTSLTVTSLFSSIAYQSFFPTLFGLCVALELTAAEEIQRFASQDEASAKAPPTLRFPSTVNSRGV